MAKLISGTRVYGSAIVDTTLSINGSTGVSSTNTGVLQLKGGIGVWGGGFFSDSVTATTFVGALSGTASLATDLSGGTAGQLVYQVGVNDTGFVGPGTAGQVLTSNGTSAPVYVNTTTLYVGRALVADSATGTSSQANNLNGGTAGQVPYQSAPNLTSFFGPGTAGEILVSGGAASPIYTSTSSIQVGYAANILAGATGSLPYQSAANATAMLSLSGTSGALLTAGASAPAYITQVTARNGTGSVSTASGQSLLVSNGGLGVIGDSHFADNVNIDGDFSVSGGTTFNGSVTFNGSATFVYSTNTYYTDNVINMHTPQGGIVNTWTTNDGKDIGLVFHNFVDGYDNDAFLGWHNETGYLEWFSKGTETESTGTFVHTQYGTFKTGAIILDNSTGVNNATSGALQVTGGVGVGGGIFVSGVVTATTFVGGLTGTATQANNLNGGTSGQLVYQSSANTTAFAGPGTAGQVLTSGGTGAPTYVNTSSLYVGRAAIADTVSGAGFATSLNGGLAGEIAIQNGTSSTTFISTASEGSFLQMGVNTATFVATSTIYVNRAVLSDNNSGGAAGGLRYQTGANASTYLNIGSAGQMLRVNASSNAPEWVNTSSVYVNSAVNAQTLFGGTAGQLVYQSGAGTTAFTGPGTSGQILVSAGTSAPTYTNTTSIQVGFADTAGKLLAANTSTQQVGFAATAGSLLSSSTGTQQVGFADVAGKLLEANTGTQQVGYSANLLAGTAGQIVYQSAANTTAFSGPGNTGEVLTSGGTGAPTYVTTTSLYVGRALLADSVTGSSGTANNIAGGALGQIPYQTGPSTTAFIGTGTNGSILVMGANTASFVTTASVYVNSAVNAEDLFGGTAGQLVYQSAPGVTAFAGPGTSGQILISAGTSAPTYTNTTSIQVGFADTAGKLLAANTTTQQVGFADTAGSILSTNTATQQVGFADVAGKLLAANTTTQQVGFADVAGSILAANTASTQVGFADVAGKLLAANTSTQQVGYSANLLAGTAGQIVYQSAANTTAFAGPGTAGEVLTSGGTGAPTYVTTTSLYVGRALVADTATGGANTANNISGGTLGQIPYQTGPSTTAFIGTGTQGTILVMGANTASFVTTSSIYVNSAVNAQTLFGGTAGQLHYQSATGVTAFAGPGTAGEILVSAGTSAPTYTSTSSIQVGFAANLLAGATGSLPYQTAANATAMLSLSGTSGALLTAGASAPAYITQVTARNGTGSISTASGQSLVVDNGGLGVIGDSHFADNVNIGKNLTVTGGTTFNGSVTFNGSATFVYSTNTYYTDNIINIHTPPGGVANTWTSNDGKDIGLVFHNFVDGYDNDAFFGYANNTGYLEWYAKGSESTTGTYSGTAYGIFKTGGARFVDSTGVNNATSGALQVTGGVGIGGGVFVSGTVTATTFVGALSGTAALATDVAGGTAGQLLYQIGANDTGFVGPGTAGQILVSAGTSAPTYTNTGSIQVGFAANLLGGSADQFAYQTAANATGFISTGSMYVGRALVADTSAGTSAQANNLNGGSLGQIPYQLAAGSTAFIGTGTNGSILQMGANTATFVTTSSIYVNSAVNAEDLFGGTAGQLVYQSAPGVTSFAGPGTSGQILVSAGTSAPTYTNTSSIYVDSAVNAQTLFGGTAGQLHYQSATGVTAFAGPGTAGQLLVSGGTGAPTYTNTGSIYVGFANQSNNLLGGALGQIAYQTALGTTGFINTGTQGTLLQMGANSPSFVTTANVYVNNAVNAEDLLGGTAGQLVYQSATGVTAFAGPGTAGQVLTSGGTGAPTYVNTSSLYVGRAAIADTVAGAGFATSLNGGLAGEIAIQNGTSSTTFISTASQGSLLQMGVNTATFITTASVYINRAVLADNDSGGAAGGLRYQTGANASTFLNIGTAGQMLRVNSGATAPEWVSTSSVYANSAVNAQTLFGGTAGQLVYQSGAGTTAFAGPGTVGQLLISGGTGTPNYQNTLTVEASVVKVNSDLASVSTTSGGLQIVNGGIGVGDSVYVKNRVGFVNNSNVSAVYQFYNAATNSLDTIFA